MINTNLSKKILDRLSSLKSARKLHEQVWKDCFDFSFPIRGEGFDNKTVSSSQIQSKKNKLLDTTLTDAARTQASAIMSGLTPANSRWFGLDVGHSTEEEKKWLDESADVLWQNIHNSNFDAAAYEGMLDLMACGWFALYVDEDRDRGGFSFQLWPISDIYCDASKAAGKIDIIYREYQLTAEQVINEFEKDLDEQTLQKITRIAKKEPSSKFDLVHAIYPREDGKQGEQAKKLPVASVHVLVTYNAIARESGYNEIPVVVPRWMLIPKSVYAVGPVSDALPDAKTLNKIKEMELSNADLAISGMWIAQDDGVLNPRTIKIGPRKVIVANSVDSMKPLQSGADFNVSFTKCDQLQAAIRKIMLADQLQPQNGPAMTATEVNMRQQLIRQLLGPIYGRMQAEYLQPLVERCFAIAFRAGVFSEMPESLEERYFSTKYKSPLARAQKFDEVTAISNFIQITMQSAQADQAVLDNIDFDKAARFTGEALGVPPSIIRTTEEVIELRKEREAQQKAAQAQAMQQQVAMTEAQAAAQASGQRMGEAANEQ